MRRKFNSIDGKEYDREPVYIRSEEMRKSEELAQFRAALLAVVIVAFVCLLTYL